MSIAQLVLEIVGKDGASKVLQSVGNEADTMGSKFSGMAPKLAAGGLAVAGFAGGVEALAQSQAEMNTIVGQNAAAIGISEGEYRKLATSISNAGFPLEDVNALLKIGREEGLSSQAQLADFANFWDMVGDATGLAGDQLAAGATGLRAVGIAAGDEKEALAAFGFITDHTKVGIDDFLSLLEKKGGTLRDFGISVDDTAAILGAMEKNLGLTGKAAAAALEGGIGDYYDAIEKQEKFIGKTAGDLEKLDAQFKAGKIPAGEYAAKQRELTTSMQAARNEVDRMRADPLDGLRDQLGLTADQFATMRQEVDGSSGVIERNADIQDKSITSVQKWKAKWDDFLFTHAGVVKSLSDFAPIAMGMGASITGISTAAGALGPMVKGIGPAFQAMSATATPAIQSMGMALITPPLGIVIAIAAVLIAAYLFRDEIIAVFRKVWEVVEPIVTSFREGVVGAFGAVLSWTKDHWPEIVTILSGPFLPLVALATDAFGIRSALTNAFSVTLGWVRDHWPEILTIISGPFAPLVALATNSFGVRDALVGAFEGIFGWFVDWGARVTGWFSALPGNILNALGDVSRLLFDKGKALIQGFINGMKSIPIPNPLSMVPGGGLVGNAIGGVGDIFRARGGPVRRNRPYIVGERGAELFVPDSAGRVISNDQMQRAAAENARLQADWARRRQGVTNLQQFYNSPEFAQNVARGGKFVDGRWQFPGGQRAAAGQVFDPRTGSGGQGAFQNGGGRGMGGGGTTLQITGPITVNAADPRSAQQEANRVVFAIAAGLRARGIMVPA